MTLTTTVTTITGEEVEATVEFTVSGPTRGMRDSLCGRRGAGPPLEPDEPAEIEIVSVTDNDGKELDLSNDELEKLENQCWLDVENDV